MCEFKIKLSGGLTRGNKETSMCYHLRSLAFLLLIPSVFLVGCGKPERVSYEATGLHREADGKIAEGAKVGPRATSVPSMSEVEVEGKKATVQLMAIDQNKVAFEITYPDGATERVQMRRGESKYFIPNGKDFGVRIHVETNT
jgi:hypothetical protein